MQGQVARLIQKAVGRRFVHIARTFCKISFYGEVTELLHRQFLQAEAEKEAAKAEHKATMVAIAKNLLNKGISIEDVSDSTGVSVEEIKRLNDQ